MKYVLISWVALECSIYQRLQSAHYTFATQSHQLTSEKAQLSGVRDVLELDVQRLPRRQTADVRKPEAAVLAGLRTGRGGRCARRRRHIVRGDFDDGQLVGGPTVARGRAGGAICDRHGGRLVDGFLVGSGDGGQRNVRSRFGLQEFHGWA